MTTPLVPDFIAALFKEEISKIQIGVVDAICDEYGLNKAEVLNKLKLGEVQFKDNNIRIIHKREHKYGSKNNNPKCIARVYDKNERTLSQCTRSQKSGCGEYCKSHFEVIRKNGKLCHGTVNDKEPKAIVAKDTVKIY